MKKWFKGWTPLPADMLIQVAVLSEWQRDWAREKTASALGEILRLHGGSTGTSFAWELQLLNSRPAV
jgi:hypothetical protein